MIKYKSNLGVNMINSAETWLTEYVTSLTDRAFPPLERKETGLMLNFTAFKSVGWTFLMSGQFTDRMELQTAVRKHR